MHPLPDDTVNGLAAWQSAWRAGLVLSLPTCCLVALQDALQSHADAALALVPVALWPEIDRKLTRRGRAA